MILHLQCLNVISPGDSGLPLGSFCAIKAQVMSAFALPAR